MVVSKKYAITSFHEMVLADRSVQPSIAVKGMMTIRLHRLHFSSKPVPRTLAMSWPHSQRVSWIAQMEDDDILVVTRGDTWVKSKLRTIISILFRAS